jgi:guanylate kinase
MTRKKLIILGKSASGKDTLRKMLSEKGFKISISHTTRPQRSNEIDGADYHFVTLEKFEALERELFFIESEKFRDWKYGRSREAVEMADLLILTASGVSNLLKHFDRENFYIVETVCPSDKRMERSALRGDDRAEIERRFIADELDFSKLRDFTVDEILQTDLENAYKTFIENFLKKVHL